MGNGCWIEGVLCVEELGVFLYPEEQAVLGWWDFQFFDDVAAVFFYGAFGNEKLVRDLGRREILGQVF